MKRILYFLLAFSTGPFIHAQAFNIFDGNQVRAGVSCGNSMFWDLISEPRYEFPAGSGTHSMYVANLWITATDSNGILRGVGDRYYAAGRDSWPGPLMNDGSAATTTAISNSFDRVWKITETELNDFVIAYNNGTLGTSYTPPSDFLTWPGNGPAGYAGQLFPYHDENSDGTYNPMDGDYPAIQGTQMLRWVFNDNLAPHTETNGPAMGIEVHVSFFGCSNPDANDAVNRTTFLEFEIINRSDRAYNDVYLGMNTDIDLGGPLDDYLRTHVATNTVQCYNADHFDEGYGPQVGYHNNPPVQSITMLRTAPVVQPILGGMMYYTTGGSSPTSDPSVLADVNNYLHNRWKDGSNLVYGDDGYMIPGAPDCRYMFPGASDPTDIGTGGIPTAFDWTETNNGIDSIPNPPGDRRAILSSGPYHFSPGQKITITYALITTQDSTLTTDSLLAKNIEEVTYITQQFNNQSLPCNYASLGLDDEAEKLSATLYPNPASDMVQVKSTDPVTVIEILSYHGSVVQMIGNNPTHFSVNNLSNGIYLVRTHFEKSQKTTIQKLVVMH